MSGKYGGEAVGHRQKDKTHLLLTSHGKQREWEGPVHINTFVKGKLITEVQDAVSQMATGVEGRA